VLVAQDNSTVSVCVCYSYNSKWRVVDWDGWLTNKSTLHPALSSARMDRGWPIGFWSKVVKKNGSLHAAALPMWKGKKNAVSDISGIWDIDTQRLQSVPERTLKTWSWNHSHSKLPQDLWTLIMILCHIRVSKTPTRSGTIIHGFDFKKLYQLVQIPCPLCPLESRVKGLWLIVAPMFWHRGPTTKR